MKNTPIKRIIIDTDPGIDDAAAILLALASPEVQLEAVTTVQGNTGVEQCTRNALGLLELAGMSHIPVAQGCTRPLVQPRLEEPVHGASGLGDARLPEPQAARLPQHAVDLLIERVLDEPGQLTILALGPLTNLALAIRKEPYFAGAVKELVIMGGALREAGNSGPLAEFNIFNDPHAAHIVFHAGMRTTLVPLDATHMVRIREKDMQTIRGVKSRVAEVLEGMLSSYRRHSAEIFGQNEPRLHDPLTLAVLLAPQLLTLEERYVDVDVQGGVSMGKTFADDRRRGGEPANMKVAMEARGEEFMELFLERVLALGRRAG